MTRIIFTLIVLCSAQALEAQVELHPLGASSVLMKAWQKKQLSAQTQKTTQSVTAQFLPFSDDFSYPGPYPDSTKWENSTSVFVNNTKATLPINMGVATFDGLMANGYPYYPAATSGSQPSDVLTSVPIRLDSTSNGVQILPTDSVYLRFYWQARGVSEIPDAGDDIKLEFYSPVDSIAIPNGYSHWFASGWQHSGYDPFSDKTFHRVMILINDPKYLQNGFRFRFSNYSTGCGDVDHWHIDAVYLNKNLRPTRDTIVPEITFTRELETLLKNYTQMPFNQFTGANDVKSSFDESNSLRNNFNTAMTVSTHYEIRDNTGTIVSQNLNGNNNVPPYSTGGFCSDPALINPSVGSFVYNNGAPFTGSASFLVKFYADQSSDTTHRNDTIYYRQNFDNYFAYDDGTAETGFGIGQNGGSSTAVGAYTAVRYQLNAGDTLRAVDIFFDPSYGVAQLENAGINVRVWDDNGGLPGNMHNDSAMWSYPVFSHNGFDVFQRYQLVKPIPFTAGSTFYVGLWQQLGLPLYVGFDMNTDHHTEIFYKTPNNTSGNTGWNVLSGFSGSLMMRPVFGDSSRAVGIKNIETPKEKVVLYPNPAANEVFANAASGVIQMTVYDMLGSVLLEEMGARLNTSSLSNGVYLVKTTTAAGRSEVQKLFIAR